VLTEFEMKWAPWSRPDQETLVSEWDFSKDTGTWVATSDCELSVTHEALAVRSTGKDPNFSSRIGAEEGPFILEVRSRSPRPVELQLFWANSKKPDFNEDNSARRVLAGNGEGWTAHRIYFKSDSELTGLRLDPGSSEGEIQFERIQLWRGSAPAAVRVELQNAKADFSQGGFDVKTAIDGKKPDDNNGWAAHPKLGEDRMATFEFKEPLGGKAGAALMFDLNQNYKGNDYSIGRFRISVTRAKSPVDFGVPDAVGVILDIAAEDRDEAQQEALMKFFRSLDGELKKKEAKLAEAKQPRPIDPELQALRGKLVRVEMPLPPDPKLKSLERAVELSGEQLKRKRLTAAQDLAWALINNPSFLFNR
jgi:hypothetical protein